VVVDKLKMSPQDHHVLKQSALMGWRLVWKMWKPSLLYHW